MDGSIFVDANVLVYTREASQADKQMRAAEWVSHLWETGTGRLSLQVLTEFYAVVTGKLKPGMEVAKARKDVEGLFARQPVPIAPDLIAEAWLVRDLFHLSWWDSFIVSAARILKCPYMLSEDIRHSQDFEGIRVIDPFRMRPGEL